MTGWLNVLVPEQQDSQRTLSMGVLRNFIKI